MRSISVKDRQNVDNNTAHRTQTRSSQENNQAPSDRQFISPQKYQENICNKYRIGIFCKFKNECKYIHKRDRSNKKDFVCKYQKRGNCKFGNKCYFYHLTPSEINLVMVQLEQGNNFYNTGGTGRPANPVKTNFGNYENGLNYTGTSNRRHFDEKSSWQNIH